MCLVNIEIISTYKAQDFFDDFCSEVRKLSYDPGSILGQSKILKLPN